MEPITAQWRAVELARTPSGLRVVRAPVVANQPKPQALRLEALERSSDAGQPCEPAQVWSALCSGRLRIAEFFQAEKQTLVVLHSRAPETSLRFATNGRRRDVLERTLGGQSGKSIALDLGLSASTISIELNKALRHFGLEPRRSGVPMFLSQLCQTARRAANRDASAGRFWLDGQSFVVLSIPQPDYSLLNQLAQAELEVCHLLLEGRSHAQIARARGTKARTTANQVSAIFEKLRVSGRMALIAQLIGGCSSQGETRAASGVDEVLCPIHSAVADSLDTPAFPSIVPSRRRVQELCVPAREAVHR